MRRNPGHFAALLDAIRPSRALPTPDDLLARSDGTGIARVELLEVLWAIPLRWLADELGHLELPATPAFHLAASRPRTGAPSPTSSISWLPGAKLGPPRARLGSSAGVTPQRAHRFLADLRVTARVELVVRRPAYRLRNSCSTTELCRRGGQCTKPFHVQSLARFPPGREVSRSLHGPREALDRYTTLVLPRPYQAAWPVAPLLISSSRTARRPTASASDGLSHISRRSS